MASKLVKFSAAQAITVILGRCFQSVSACGGFFCEPQNPIIQAGENIAFGVKQVSNADSGTPVLDITMSVQINYEGPAEKFGWLLPVPTKPSISVGSDILFERLFQASRPTFEFTIDSSRSTCNEESLFPICPEADFDFASPAAEEDVDESEATVLEQGVVGPFEFVTLEADDHRPESIFEWLQENGYDQPTESQPLINYYAGMDMKFVALRLTSDSETGDIRPIVLSYRLLPSLGNGNDGDNGDTDLGGMLLERVPVACIPIQLTSIAASPSMPIQIYTFSNARAFPLNYFHVTMDEQQVGWLNCNNFGGVFRQDCYLNDLRDRFDRALDDIDGHGFITEYAGSSDIVANVVAIDISVEDLKAQTTPKGFLTMLADSDIPDISFVHTIIEQYIPNRFTTPINSCQSLQNVYTPDTPWLMNDCLDYVDFSGADGFDNTGLADELIKKVIDPAKEAQMWINEYPYMTRLYGQLDPEEMIKDPFFAFNSQLNDVSREHRATGVPICNDKGEGIGLDVYIKSDSGDEEEPYFLAASNSCGSWVATGGQEVITPASKLEAIGYSGQETRLLERIEGAFSVGAIEQMVAHLDGRVPNQTIGSFNVTDEYTASSDGAISILKTTCITTALLIWLVLPVPL